MWLEWESENSAMMLQHLRTLHPYTLPPTLSGTCRYDFLTQQSSRSHYLLPHAPTRPSHTVSNLTQSPKTHPTSNTPPSQLHVAYARQNTMDLRKSSSCDGYPCGVSLLHWSQTGPRGLKSVSCRNYRFCACPRLHYTV
jgi:hypothetical protein